MTARSAGLCLTLVAALASASPAAASSLTGERAHASVTISGRGVALSRFLASSRLSHGRVIVDTQLSGIATSTPGTYVLAAYSCWRTLRQRSSCRRDSKRKVSFSTATATDRRLTLSAVAPNALGSVVLTLTRTTRSFLTSAYVALPTAAWTTFSSTPFGIEAPRAAGSPAQLVSLRADAAATSPTRMRPLLAWTSRQSQALSYATRLQVCETPECPTRSAWTTTGALGGTAGFFKRPGYIRPGAPVTWTFSVSAGDQPLATVRMPWPG